MKGKNTLTLIGSILLIVISSQIGPTEWGRQSAVQQLLLGVGLIGCLLAMWRFIKGGKKRS